MYIFKISNKIELAPDCIKHFNHKPFLIINEDTFIIRCTLESQRLSNFLETEIASV